MIRGNHSSSSGEEEEMARFSLGREEDDNDEGPSSPTRRPVKRRRTTAGTFSCSDVIREQERERERERERIVEEEIEEEAEDWGLESESEENFQSNGDGRVGVRDSEVSRGNMSTSREEQNLEGSRGNGSIFVTLSDPDVLDCPICLEHLCTPVFQAQGIQASEHILQLAE